MPTFAKINKSNKLNRDSFIKVVMFPYPIRGNNDVCYLFDDL